ncbi:MAG: SufE family protein [Pseudomonadota bacterium]|nr:SufE family protein [Pseudomonadota bacterium]
MTAVLETPPQAPPGPEAALAELAEEFELLGDWEERYRHVIDLGRELEPLAPAERTEANKVRGCASQVWLLSQRSGPVLRFRGDSDAHIVRGLIAILLRLYSGRTPEQILAFDARSALADLGLSAALSTQRSNGLSAMLARIKAEAEEAAA